MSTDCSDNSKRGLAVNCRPHEELSPLTPSRLFSHTGGWWSERPGNPEGTPLRGQEIVNKRKLLKRAAAGSKNIRFGDMASLVEAFGFRLARVSGSHHIFEHPNLPEMVNLQDLKGKAKPYQVKQFLELVENYNLQLGEE